jgi:hypothetical protein
VQLFDNAASKDVPTNLRSSIEVSILSNLMLIAVEQKLSDKLIRNPDKIIAVFANLQS